jgi:hypothetical protein
MIASHRTLGFEGFRVLWDLSCLIVIISIAIKKTVTTVSMRREAGLNLIGLISPHRRP